MTVSVIEFLLFSLLLTYTATVLCDGSVQTNEIISKDKNNGGDACTNECLKKVSTGSNIISSGESCSRGCRFFTLAQLIEKKQKDGKPFISEACKAMCQESYGDKGFDASSCLTGCDSSKMKSVKVPVVAELSWSWFIDSGNSLQILQGEIPEPDDVLTDPSLRSQITRVETLRIPEIRLRTMPLFQDKSIQVDSGPALCTGITIRGIQSCLVWSLLLLLTLVGLWSCVGEVRDHHHHHHTASPTLLHPVK